LIVFKRTRNDIRSSLVRATNTQGLDVSQGIAREIVDLNTGFMESDYLDIYAMEKNTRIDTAEDGFLDNYGLLLDEPRTSQSFAQVVDLKTIALFLKSASGRRARGNQLTVDGGPLVIEKGTLLLDATGTPRMKTSHTVELTNQKVYVKAIAINSGSLSLPANTLSLCLFDLRSSSIVDQNLVGDFVLGCTNEVDISSSSRQADTETYRFILQEKAASVNLASDRKINTIMDNLQVKKFVIDRINSSSTSFVIYVETRNVETDSLVLDEIKAQLESILPKGTDVRVRPFVYSTLAVSLKITVEDDSAPGTVKELFKQNYITRLNLIDGGTTINLGSILTDTINVTTGVKNADYDKILINGRTFTNASYTPKSIEKLFVYPTTLSYRV
jgi:hypothetical protein